MEQLENFISFKKGYLAADSEQKLFSKLAEDSELRNEFKCFISITDAAEKSSAAFAPSAELTNSVFASLGLQNTYAPSAPIVKNRPLGGLLNSKLFIGLLSSLLTLVIATLLVRFLFDEIKQSVNDKPAYVSAGASNYEIPEYIIIEKKNSNSKSNISASKSISAGKLASQIAESAKQSSDEFSSPDYELTNTIENSILSPKRDYVINSIKNNNSGIILPINAAQNNYSENAMYELTIAGNAGWFDKSVKVQPMSFSPFNNANIAISYIASDILKLGLDIRQETFYCEYTGTEPDKSLYKYMQQPNFTTISGFAKLYPYDLNNIKSYLKLSLGGNSGGLVLRPGLGFDYYLYNNIGFNFGFDYSLFIYQHQNSTFNASKYGISYGVNYKF